VLPDGIAGSRSVVDFLADHVSPRTALNVMAQYRPAHNAHAYPSLRRRPSFAEVDAVKAYARQRGMTNII
jgi:putative pyruvate formate lyase activating enzyme